MEDHVTLEHAFLYVHDLDRTLSFYERLLPGWGLRWQGEAAGEGRWVHFGPAGDGQPGYLSLYEDRQLAPRVADGARIEIAHIGFAHPDVDALEHRLAADGIVPTDRADDGRYRRLYFEDPDGHELEFVQGPPAGAR